ncbi:uncharacterized protein LOC135938796 [Cloeon dipterum]|uniref:uncharacterized protein LOC135938796 n=1 Tax=Cloeon dipterum TaxID=197152 RepID=UPI0032209525
MLSCFLPARTSSNKSDHQRQPSSSSLQSRRSNLSAMDLMYLPDTYSYNYYNYEDDRILWGPDKSKSKVEEKPRHKTTSKSGDHKNCPMCKANQRRRLNNYIRSKSRQDSESTIEEEDEEEAQGK